MLDIISIARECPGTILSVKADDLIAANNQLVERILQENAKRDQEKESLSYLTREMVLSKLSIGPTTLWRWAKTGYLVPINIGGQRRYKSTDINDILEGKR